MHAGDLKSADSSLVEREELSVTSFTDNGNSIFRFLIPLIPFVLIVGMVWSRAYAAQPAKTLWLLSPSLDLLLVSGGLVFIAAPILLLLQAASGSSALTMSGAMLLVGALLFTDTHFGVSFTRAIRARSNSKLSLTVLAALITFFALNLASLPAATIAGCKIYLLVIVAHYAHQTVRILNKYAVLNDYGWSRLESLSISALVYGLSAQTIAAQLSQPLQLAKFLELDMPYWRWLPLWSLEATHVFTAIAATTLTAGIIAHARAKRECLPLPVALLLLSTVGLFSIVGTISHTYWIFVPAFMHGTQSLAEAIQSSTEQGNDPLKAAALMKLLLPGFLFGAFLMFCLAPMISHFSSPRLAYPAVLLVVSAFHFIADALNGEDDHRNVVSATPVN